MKTSNDEQPDGTVSSVVKEYSPNGYEYFITGIKSKEVLSEFNTLEQYIQYCNRIELGHRKHFKFHPDPFKKPI